MIAIRYVLISSKIVFLLIYSTGGSGRRPCAPIPTTTPTYDVVAVRAYRRSHNKRWLCLSIVMCPLSSVRMRKLTDVKANCNWIPLTVQHHSMWSITSIEYIFRDFLVLIFLSAIWTVSAFLVIYCIHDGIYSYTIKMVIDSQCCSNTENKWAIRLKISRETANESQYRFSFMARRLHSGSTNWYK